MNKTGDYNTTGEGGRYADSSSKTRDLYDRPNTRETMTEEQKRVDEERTRGGSERKSMTDQVKSKIKELNKDI